MTESTFLNGRVVKLSLPVIQGRGELAQIYDSDEGIRYLAFIELRKDTVRGNHYHEAKNEVIYVIQGEIQLAVEDIVTKERASFCLSTGDLAILPVRIAHGFRTVVAGQGVEWSPTRFDAADITPYRVIE